VAGAQRDLGQGFSGLGLGDRGIFCRGADRLGGRGVAG
jgi:hypothetical protein